MQSSPGRVRGIALLILSVSLFGIVDGLSKVLVDSLSFGQIMLARYAFGLPVILIAIRANEWTTLFVTERPGTQIVRGFAPLIIGGSMVIAVGYLPLAEATVILFAGPFIVVALSGRLLGEHVGIKSWAAVVTGFVAVLIVARPGFWDLSAYAVFPLLAALFYAVFQLLTRRLAAVNESPNRTLAWTFAVGLLAAVPLAVSTWTSMSASGWMLSIALGLTFGLAQLFLAQAFIYASANVLAPFSYFQIIAATAFGVIAFHDIPDLWTILGIILIVGAGAMVLRDTPAK